MVPAVIVRDLTFVYLHSDRSALERVSFEVEQGSITALVGALGAGKSTLLRSLNGIIPRLIPGRLEGEILVAGQDVRGKDPAFMAALVNLVFDDPTLQIVSMTAEQDVAFGPANLGLPRDTVWKRVAEAMRTVGLEGFEKRDPRTMSGGEQQLLALAGVLAMRPQIIALDEPVAMLDPLGKHRVLQAVQSLNREYGTTILIAESGSDIEAVCDFADTLILMHEGRVLSVGNPGAVFADRDLIEQSRLKVPQVTRLAYALNLTTEEHEVPVTVQACRDLLGELGPSGALGCVAGASAMARTAHPELSLGSGETAIAARNVHHVFPTEPPVHALRGIDLDIEAGEFVALLGQNGSGKSTLAFHLVGADKPTNADASVLVNGLDVIRAPLGEIVRHINYLFQNPANQLFCETFGQEATFGPMALGYGREESQRRGQEAMRLVGLDSYWDDYTLNADRSQEALLSLAAILSMQPTILIADEPTGGLDHQAGEMVMKVLEAYNRQGRTVIIITHDIAMAAQYARRVVILRQGAVWMDGSPREVFSQAERLALTQLAPPQITVLAQSMADKGIPPDVLNVPEFVSALSGIAETGIG